MGVFMAEVYMYIYNWQEKKEENQGPKIFVMRPRPSRAAPKSAFGRKPLNFHNPSALAATLEQPCRPSVGN
jgi:hypothetical protein